MSVLRREQSDRPGDYDNFRSRHTDALAACAYTLRIRPGYLRALTNRANILLQSGQAEAAILACDELLRRNPEHPQCLGIRGAAFHKLGSFEEALAMTKPSGSILLRPTHGSTEAMFCKSSSVIGMLWLPITKHCILNQIIPRPVPDLARP